jgi:DNA-binding NarL/FixJ family response regulator
MEAIDTVVLIGAESDWPNHLDDDLRGSGFAPTHAESVHSVSLLARHQEVRAIVVDARALTFGDVVTLHRVRAQTPRVALVVVGIGAATQAMHDAIDADATAYVARGQMPAQLIEVLRSPRSQVNLER